MTLYLDSGRLGSALRPVLDVLRTEPALIECVDSSRIDPLPT
jgi:hypothetical protein